MDFVICYRSVWFCPFEHNTHCSGKRGTPYPWLRAWGLFPSIPFARSSSGIILTISTFLIPLGLSVSSYFSSPLHRTTFGASLTRTIYRSNIGHTVARRPLAEFPSGAAQKERCYLEIQIFVHPYLCCRSDPWSRRPVRVPSNFPQFDRKRLAQPAWRRLQPPAHHRLSTAIAETRPTKRRPCVDAANGRATQD
jgi:hypothetical protein